MKKAIAVVLALAFTNVYAYNETPYDKFSTNSNFTKEVKVVWVGVDNVRATCDAESKKRGLGGLNVPMEACSFWDKGFSGNTCTVFTPKKLDYWIIGHEMRHCFQGNFH